MTLGHAGAPLSWPVHANALQVGGMTLPELAARVGRTPFYVYDRALLAQRIAALRAALPTSVELHYAVKANPMPALVGWMSGQVDGFDVASGGELQLVLDTGMPVRDISFAGPGKTEAELEQALMAGVLVNVESMREIRLLGELSRRYGRAARVAVRVNPDFELRSSGMRMGGGAKPFGIDAEAVPQALHEIRSRELDFEGFHIFWGSQNLDAAAVCEAQTKAFALAVRLSEHAPCAPRVLNLGGGFGIPYFPNDRPLDLAAVGAHLHELAATAAGELPSARLVIELGRYLVGEAGLYVCRVLDRKVSRGEVFLVTDGGMHHHLAASGNFGQVLRKNYPVLIGNRVQGEQGGTEVVSVVGPLCTPLDLLGDRMALPVAQDGDLVVVAQSGAYGLSASPTGFLGHPGPAEVLV
ncbi:pyridoxal-dependent decarboxylase, exosortase A system-associated [Paucibacter sp. XJ19-41]|nr:pyridoxal-dependent decarboxylase, exosortase A system-associated [Paucibacter sp. XJ19-41]MDC6167144.1 pyridoxal-dependent decarboxylase, exosortase A system-associated [Paucibacter sp. XJ19-41]